jgi:hypothetical protein
MAITRAQQYRQMLENGGRGISLQEAKDMAPKGEFLAYINKKEAKMLKDAGGSGIMTNAGIPSFIEYDGGDSGTFSQAASTGSVQGDVDRGGGDDDRGRDPTKQFEGNKPISKEAEKALKAQRKKARYQITPSTRPSNRIISTLLSQVVPFGGMLYNRAIDQRAMGFGPTKITKKPTDIIFNDDDDDNQNMITQTPYQEDTTEDDVLSPIEQALLERGKARAFAKEGGRIGLQEGGGIEQRLEQLGGDVSSAEQLLQGINKRLQTAESSLGSSGGGLGSTAPAGSGIFAGRPVDIGGVPQPIPPQGNILGPGKIDNQGQDPFEDPLRIGGNLGQIPEQFKSGFAEYLKNNETSFGFGGQAISGVGLPGGGSVMFGDTGSAGAFRDYLKSTGFDSPSPLGQPLPGLPGVETIQASGTFNDKPLFPEGTTFPSGGMKLPVFTGTPQQIDPPIFMRPGNIPGTDVPFSTLRGGMQSQGTSGVPALGFADGGRIGAAEGGIMDLETGRQMYFLGKLVKKATRAVKKIVKSPIGKAALLYGGFQLGKMPIGDGGSLFDRGFDFYSNMETADKVKLGIGGALTLAPLLFQDDDSDEEYKQFASQSGPGLPAAIPDIRKNYRDYMARAFVADGGTPEPVAKKTMPLLDMDGKEMDLRAEGGFVPIGRMEKADDVPARLSKNEFVFTADAVRNAGDGDVDKGAEVMYNMMKNLESGGDVSEESQGLEGARRMFQTSQRLEEVL